MSKPERLEWVNEHRAAVGREPFADLSEEELVRHEQLIAEHAPYGNDPWHTDFVCMDSGSPTYGGPCNHCCCQGTCGDAHSH